MRKPTGRSLFPEEPAPAAVKGRPKMPTGEPPKGVDPIEEMVYALTDPIVVYPSGWEDTIPQHLKDRVPLERLARNMRCHRGEASWDEATDLEALLYMYPATLAHPLCEQWTRIYLYLGTTCLGDKLPQDIRQESLSDYDIGELRSLKRWIRKQQVKARKERSKDERAVVPVNAERTKLF